MKRNRFFITKLESAKKGTDSVVVYRLCYKDKARNEKIKHVIPKYICKYGIQNTIELLQSATNIYGLLKWCSSILNYLPLRNTKLNWHSLSYYNL